VVTKVGMVSLSGSLQDSVLGYKGRDGEVKWITSR